MEQECILCCPGGEAPGKDKESTEGPRIRLKVEADFSDMKDEAVFAYDDGNGFQKIGTVHKLRFMLDHFCGCRFGLFVFATKETGGSAKFRDFIYS